MDNNLAERRAVLLHAAAQVSRNITSILNLDELLATTVDVICDQFGFYYAGVFLLDEMGKWAILRAGRGAAGAQMIAAGHKLEVGGKSMIGMAIAQRKALIALDVGDEPVHFDNPLLPGTRSEMALPLFSGNVIGALTVQSEREAAFNDDDIIALQMMADQLAVAIQNARLYEHHREALVATQRQARLLEAAAEVGHGVTSILDMQELLSKTVDIICDAYGFYFACVYLIDETGEWLVARAAHGEAGRQMLEAGHRLKVGGKSMNGTVAVQGKARIAQNVDDDPVHFKNPLLSGTQAEVVLPLLVSGQIIGTLTVQSTHRDAFGEDDITSLQTMADQLAIAINNARLLQELKAAHAELVRSKTFEALATSTVEAIHWIGNKALPISTSVARLREDLGEAAGADTGLLASMREDLDMIDANARLIISVQEHLIGPAREQKPQPTMVDDVLNDVLVEMGLADKAALSVASDLPLALADATQLCRALGYVLQNAVEAVEGAAAPKIAVKVAPTEDGHYVAIRVTDNGPVIPEGDLDKVWAAFYTTKGLGHAGLGLSATLQIMRQLEGKVSIGNVDDGVQVELRVPVAGGALARTLLPGGKKVLLVDDAGTWSQWLESALTDAGNTVVVATSVPEAAGFDLILLDDVLVGNKTLPVIRQLRKSGLTGQTVVVASRLRVERTMELMNLGVRDVVAKPYTIVGLAEILS